MIPPARRPEKARFSDIRGAAENSCRRVKEAGRAPTTAAAGASDLASLGSGLWFAPGFSEGATYILSAYKSIASYDRPAAWGFNFTHTAQANPFVPTFQVFLSSATGFYADPNAHYSGNWNGVSAALGYLYPTSLDPAPALPRANALIGFGWGGASTQTVRYADGLLVGPNPSDTDFVSTAGTYIPGGITFDKDGKPIITEPSNTKPTRFTPLYATAAVPEPASWALIIAGFAAVGAALRRRPRQAPAMA